MLAQNGLCINPSVNLVSNIGFGPDALNCKDPHDPLANVPTEPMAFPLRHPPLLAIDEEADALIQKTVFHINETRLQRFKWFLKARFSRPYRMLKRVARRPDDAIART